MLFPAVLVPIALVAGCSVAGAAGTVPATRPSSGVGAGEQPGAANQGPEAPGTSIGATPGTGGDSLPGAEPAGAEPGVSAPGAGFTRPIIDVGRRTAIEQALHTYLATIPGTDLISFEVITDTARSTTVAAEVRDGGRFVHLAVVLASKADRVRVTGANEVKANS